MEPLDASGACAPADHVLSAAARRGIKARSGDRAVPRRAAREPGRVLTRHYRVLHLLLRIALGSMAIMDAAYITGGAGGAVVRRILECVPAPCR